MLNFREELELQRLADQKLTFVIGAAVSVSAAAGALVAFLLGGPFFLFGLAGLETATAAWCFARVRQIRRRVALIQQYV